MKPQAVIGLCCGTRPDGEPDPVNQRLADLCDEVASNYDVPSVLQGEIGRRAVRCDLMLEGAHYLDTHGALLCARKWSEGRSINSVAIVAGSFHLWRATRTARTLGFHVAIERTTSDMFDPKSEQWWTRNIVYQIPRESLAICYYWLRGWI